MNLASILILTLVLGLAAYDIYLLSRSRRKGKDGSCNSQCGSCGLHGRCGKK